VVSLLAAVGVVALSLGSATTEELHGRTIDEIRVEGAPSLEMRAAAENVLGLRVGEPLDIARVRLAIRRVALTGPWADVQIDALLESPVVDGVPAVVEGGPGERLVLLVTLVPDVIIEDVTIHSSLPHERLRALAGLEAGMRFREDRVDDAKLAIRRGAAELGYPRAEVKVDIEATSDSSRRLVIDVEPGTPVVLKELVIEGEPRLARAELEDLLGAHEGEPFERLRVEQGLERVHALLTYRRHLDARVRVIDVVTDSAGEHAIVTLEIDAGPRYRMRFLGNEIESDARLVTAVNIATLEGADPMSLERAKVALETHYKEAGFSLVKVAVDVVSIATPAAHKYESFRDADDGAEREVRFRIAEGARAEVKDITVQGAKARNAEELVEDVRATIEAAQPSSGLLQRVDLGDVDDLLGNPSGEPVDTVADIANGQQAKETRAFELSDEGFELLPRPFIGKKPVYLEAAFVEAGRRVLDLYRADGFLDARVRGPNPVFSPDGREVNVSYTVEEGPRVVVAAVQFVDARCPPDSSACEQTLPLRSLVEDLDLVPGGPASFAAITDTRAKLEKNLQNMGYPFARVTEAVRRTPGAPTADVVYTVDTGARVSIGGVRIKGNARTQDLVIRDRITLDEGDLYSAEEVEASRQRLARLGLFSTVSIELLDDDPNASVRDLLVIVKERPTFAVEVGAGASVEDGPRAFVAAEVRNIAGLGVGIRGRGQLNYPRAFYDLLYDAADPNNPLNRFLPTDEDYAPAGSSQAAVIDWVRFFEGQLVLGSELPKVYGMPFDTRLHVDTVALREIRPAFTLNRGSINAGADMNPASWLTVSPQIEGEFSDFDCPRDLRFGQSCGQGSIGLTRRRDAGFIRQTTYRLSLSTDFRDHPVRPRSGFWLFETTDLALGSGELRTSSDATISTPVTSDFVKLTGGVAGYVPLAQSFTLAMSFRAGNIFPFGPSYIPLFKRFYLGGTSSIRGFREDEILPADDPSWPADSLVPLDPKNVGFIESRQSLGGNFFVNGRTELRIALVGDLELATFVDIGQLDNDVSGFTPIGLAAGAGAGLRYNTPVGPFVIDLGWKVLDGRRQLPPFSSLDRMNLHLSIGTF
jgi:outer membrane protein assembly factor BamA